MHSKTTEKKKRKPCQRQGGNGTEKKVFWQTRVRAAGKKKNLEKGCPSSLPQKPRLKEQGLWLGGGGFERARKVKSKKTGADLDSRIHRGGNWWVKKILLIKSKETKRGLSRPTMVANIQGRISAKTGGSVVSADRQNWGHSS